MLQRLRNLFNSLLATNGELSMVRFLSLICVVTACVLAFIGMFTSSHTLESVSLLCGTFLTAGLGAKVLQRQIESKSVASSSGESRTRTFHSSTSIDNVNESGENEDKK